MASQDKARQDRLRELLEQASLRRMKAASLPKETEEGDTDLKVHGMFKQVKNLCLFLGSCTHGVRTNVLLFATS